MTGRLILYLWRRLHQVILNNEQKEYRRTFGRFGSGSHVINPIKLVGNTQIFLGNEVSILDGARIELVTSYAGRTYRPELHIAENVSIEQNLHLTCADRITIGRNTAITANVTITDILHGRSDTTLPFKLQPLTTRPVTIGEGCLILNGAVICPGTELANSCIVAPNSVVRGSFPAFSLVAGMPARIVKRLDSVTGMWESPSNDEASTATPGDAPR